MNVCLTDIQTMLIFGGLAFVFFEAMLITRKKWFLSFLNAITPINKDLAKEELSFGGFAAINLMLVTMAGLVSFVSKVIYDFKDMLYGLYLKTIPAMTIIFYAALGITVIIIIKYGLYMIYKANKSKKEK